MTQDLAGKTILFIGPAFFGYERRIIEAMQQRGATVHFRSDKPSRHSIVKALLRMAPALVWPWTDRLFNAWLSAENITHCDIVLIVKGESVSLKFLRQLRARFATAQFVMYQWDSVANVKHTVDKLPLFDRILSFDPMDCQCYTNIAYRPLFFSETSAEAPAETGGDGLFFLGTLNGDRPRVLARVIRSMAEGVPFDYGLFVRSKIELALRKLFDPSFGVIGDSHLFFEALSADSIDARMQQHRAVLDIEHPKQTGLTMRSFEVLAAGKKLVTTNRTMALQEFYDPSRICIIDREHPVIPPAFLASVCTPLPESFYEKYSLAGWLNEVLPPH